MQIRYSFLVVAFVLLFGCLNFLPSPENEIIPVPVSPEVPPSETSGTPNISVAEPPSEMPASSVFPSTEPPLASIQPLPPGPSFIDSVYVWDLEQNAPALGRVLVAGNTYEVIAENRMPFADYVRFSVVVDGEVFDEADAYCPESCASETMYSIPLTIPEGEFQEIQILAEDGGGAQGKSPIYRYADSFETASYLAETCSVDTSVAGYGPRNGENEAVFYGGTITDGWPEGTTVSPYDASADFPDLCDELSAQSVAAGIQGGFLAQTNCNIQFTYTPTVQTQVDRQACTCTCTATASGVQTTKEATVLFPNWTDYGSATQCQQEEWDRFIQNGKTHEEGHVQRCEEGRADIETRMQAAPSKQGQAATCQLACDAAVERLDADLGHRFDEGFAASEQEQTAYDSENQHGRTQGAVLDCSAC